MDYGFLYSECGCSSTSYVKSKPQSINFNYPVEITNILSMTSDIMQINWI